MALSQKHEGKMLVPWFNSNEWKYIKELIFEDLSTYDDKKQALDILRMWKLRTPKLASGVEGTLIVLDAMLQAKATISPENLRILYGSALMRFLNLCGAGGDKQGTFYQIAKQNNIPDWLINLRHEVAHDQVIPSQYMLDLALQFCLNWLKTEYWEKQSRSIADFISVAEMKTNISATVELYCQLNLMYYLNKNYISNIKDITYIDVGLTERISAYKDIANINEDMEVQQAIDLILENIHDRIRDKQQNQAELIASNLVTNGSIFAVQDHESPEIPHKFALIWQELINSLYIENMLFPLLKNLLKVCNDEDAQEQTRNMASLWLAELFKALLLAKRIQEKYTDIPEHEILHKKCAETCLRNDIIKKNPELQVLFHFDFANCSQIIKDVKLLHMEAASNPHQYTLNFLKYLLELCDCQSNYINNVEMLVKSYTVLEETIESDYEMHTAEELEKLISSNNNTSAADMVEARADVASMLTDDTQAVTCNPQKDMPKKKWRIVEDKSIFEGCPLGILSFQSRDVNPLLEQFQRA